MYIVDYVRFIILSKIKTDAGIKKCLQESKKCCTFASRSARVRQLKRTELAWRVESAQCLRSPQKLKIFGGPIDKKQRYENKQNSIIFQKNARFACVCVFFVVPLRTESLNSSAAWRVH